MEYFNTCGADLRNVLPQLIGTQEIQCQKFCGEAFAPETTHDECLLQSGWSASKHECHGS
jgi:hypothetical protein